ncbi:MAG: DDE-type integrase/transposase/recombinase [Mycobacterium leprae]
MRPAGLAGRHQRRRRCLTRPDARDAPAPDLIGRDFAAAAIADGSGAGPAPAARPGARMVGDITYLATGEGWLCLADVLDLATRAVLGCAMAEHMRAELVVDALDMAAARLPLPPDAIFHSDRGSQRGFKGSSQHLRDPTGGTVARREPRRVSSSRGSCGAVR